MKPRSRPVDDLRKQFHREWLLIALDAVDESTATPISGRLLAHSPHRDEIYASSRRYRHPALIVYSEDEFPKGFAAAFYGV